MVKKICFSVLVVISMAACSSFDGELENLEQDLINTIESNQYVDGMSSLQLPNSGDYDNIPQDPNNPIIASKVELGMMLFHETAIASESINEEGKYTYSCASCHHAGAGFQAGLAQGIGEGGMGYGFKGEGRFRNDGYKLTDLDVQPLRSPTVLNSAYQDVMLWNGQFGATGTNAGTESQWKEGTPIATNELGYQGVETQAIAGIAVHRMKVDPTFVENNEEYKKLFDMAFSEFDTDRRYSNETAGLAIAAYERTVIANQAPFQNWLMGRSNSLTSIEMRGAIVFFGKGECATCHNGPSLSSMEFHAIGLDDLDPSVAAMHGLNDDVKKGRGGFTGNPDDDYAFKVPQLYSIQASPFYGHGSSMNNIAEVIRYKNRGVKENADVPDSKISPHFKPLGLTENEIKDLTQFIRTGLYDNNLQRYAPSSVISGNCFPNNDQVSKEQLYCG